MAMPPGGPALPRSALDRLLRPRSVAVVGASPTPGSLGASVLANLERGGFGGAVHLVHPRRREVAGRPCLGTIDELPEGVDCAVLAIPRAGVLEAAAACARRGVGSLIAFSAGFAESGAAGAAEQAELARIARRSGMLVLGPNCLGTVNNLDGVALTFVAAPLARPTGGGVAIVSQSGAMATVLGVSLAARELGVTFSVSTGNEAASGVEDFVEYVLDDGRTALVTLIVEQFRDPRRFLELVRRARREGMHVVLLHPGASAAARASAATHTGAIAGDHEVMRTCVSRAGVVVVDTLEELCDVTDVLVRCPSLPRGGAAVLAESGAFKAMALDLGEALGLPLPPFGEATAAALRQALPEFIEPGNPLDLTAQGLVDPGLYRRTLPPVLAEERCGSVLLAIILTDKATGDRKLPPILEAIEEVRPTKPVLFAGLDEGAPIAPSHVRRLRELGVPFFPSHERALRALARLSSFADQQAAFAHGEPEAAAVARQLPAGLVPGAGVVPEHRSKAILAALGMPVPAGALARTVDEAQAVAARVGFPVALKAQSARLAHKSDAGGVILGVADAAALAAAWGRLHAQLAERAPALLRDGPLDGVLVERMASPGVELIAGARVDPEWGPVLLVGLGGVLAEVLRDFRVLPPDAPPALIEAALRGLRGARLLDGFRGGPPADVEAAARAIRALGDFVLAAPDLAEVDLNPLVVHPRGEGATVLDALLVLRGAR